MTMGREPICTVCHGTGVEPVALVEREVLDVCQAMSQCPLNARLAAVVEAGERMARFIESASYLHGSDGERACALLAAWKKVLE